MRLLIVAFVQVCYLLVPRRGHWLLRRDIGFYGTSCHGPMLTRPIAFVQVYYLDFHGNAIGFYGEATGFRGEAVEFYGDATAFHGETIGFTERPLISTERSLISTERPLVSTERPLISTERPFLSTERPLFLRGGLFWSYVNEIDCICTSVSSGLYGEAHFGPTPTRLHLYKSIIWVSTERPFTNCTSHAFAIYMQQAGRVSPTIEVSQTCACRPAEGVLYSGSKITCISSAPSHIIETADIGASLQFALAAQSFRQPAFRPSSCGRSP